jgi:hypothetical protein
MKDILKVMTKYFNIFGYPDVFRSDNGPQFRTEMKTFLESRGIRLLTRSPYFPSSNCHAESGVKSAKHLLKKCKDEKSDFETALAELRRQPRSDGSIPSELFLYRHVKGDATQLPREQRELPVITATPKSAESAKKKKNNLPTLKVGQFVRVQNALTKRWDRKAIISGICEFSRSYIMNDCDDDTEFRRNRIFLHPFTQNEEPEIKLAEEEETDKTEEVIPKCISPVSPRRSARIANNGSPPQQTRDRRP